MLTKTHATSGLAIWTTGITIANLIGHDINPIVAITSSALCYYSAELPDIDHPDSHPTRVISRFAPEIPRAIQDMCGHRGMTHWGINSISVGILIGSAATLIHPSLWWIGLAIGTGILVHVLGDCLTWSGAPLLAPFVDRPIRLPYGYRFESGGKFENMIVYPFVLFWALFSVVISVSLTVI